MVTFAITPIGQDTPRLSMILWGESGTGKTTLAATAPGKKLLILLDPDGDMTIRTRKDVVKIDMTQMSNADIINDAKKPDPYGLKAIIAEHGIDTVIIDSLSRFSEVALRYIIPLTYKATPENPTPAGYGARNLIVINFINTLLQLTRATNTHIIFITHEGAPDKNDQGSVLSVSMMLGGQLPGLASKDISEVWNMSDMNGKKRIAFRPERLRTPMKTRILDTSTDKTGFEWKYNDVTNVGWTIDGVWQEYIKNNCAKVKTP
jgi:hypothetical protein